MTDENLQPETAAEGAPALPVEADQVVTPTTTDEATESPADDASESRPKGVGKRIDELTRNWREAERREAALLAMLQERQAPKAEPTPAPAPIKEPDLADYEYDEAKFKVALGNFYEAKARAAAEAVIAERENAAREKAKAQTFKQKEAEFKAKAPDYESVAYYAPISNEVAELVRESDIGPELAYYLGKNPELAQTISQLPEKAAAREIGKIEAKLSFQKEAARPAAAKPAVSQAPPPPPKIEAVEPEVTRDPDQMPINEWLKWRNKQLNRKKA